MEIAVRSDWKVSAGLAAACVFGGAVLVPAFLGGSPVLRPVGALFAQLEAAPPVANPLNVPA